MRKLVNAVCAILAVAVPSVGAPPDALPGSDWPTYRHDGSLAAISPLKGGLANAPRIEWSFDLGGPAVPSTTVQIHDVTGDGQEEVLIIGEDSVECRQASGSQLWKLERYPKPAIVAIRDWAGDGTRGILLTTSLGGRVETFMIDGQTGHSAGLWKDENNFGGHTRFGKLLARIAGEQVASTSSGQTPPAPHGGHIRLVSFESGLTRPRFRIRQFLPGEFYSPIMCFDDSDADGILEMMVISHEGLWSFDTETGRQELTAHYGPAIRTYYATIASVKFAAAGRFPALVMINPHIPGLRAVRQDGKSQAETIWKVVIGGKEDQYQSAIKIVPGGSDVAYDLDGDGTPELVASITNEHGDQATHLVVFDAATGRRLAQAGDEQILSLDDLDGDGVGEVLLRAGTSLRITHWIRDRFVELWRGERVEPLLRPLPSEGSLSRTSGGNMPVWRESPGSDRFLLRFTDGVGACRLDGTKVIRAMPIPIHEAFGNLPDNRHPEAARITFDGHTVVARKGTDRLFAYEVTAPPTYLAPPPLVADIGGSRQIIVRDANGKLVFLTARGTPASLRIDNVFEHFQTHVDHAASGPTVCDMDGDGDNELVVTVADSDGKPYCAILDGTGKLERRIDLEPGTKLLNRGPTGSRGPGRGRWIILRMYYGEGAYQGRRPLVVAFDGKTGKRLWIRDHYATYGPNPVIFAAHLPTAVHDLDGDGADDWLVCSENFYGVISVEHNRDLVGPVVLSDAVPGHWTAYTYPSLGKVRPGGELALLHNNAYAMALITDLRGKPLWHEGLTRDTGGTWGILANLDGRGVDDFVQVQPDGLIRCFEVSASRSRCATCPTTGGPQAPPPDVAADPSRWSVDLKCSVSRIAAGDLDADGRHELLFGASDGHLYALAERSGRAQILWKVPLDRRVGEPILVDLDGDRRAEILVTTEAGRLYCLRAPAAASK